MRTRLLAATAIFGLAVTLTACGGGSSDASSSDKGGTDQTTAAPDSGSDGAKGDVNCKELQTAAQQLLSVQLLAQLDSPDNIAAVKDGTIGTFDPEKFLAGMKTLHQLDSYSGALGDPKSAIDAYEDAGKQAQELLEADPPTQTDIDAYMKSIGTTDEFLAHQAPISGALAAAGC